MLHSIKKTVHNKGAVSIRIKTKDKAFAIALAALEKKAQDPVLIEMRRVSSVADYFLVCSANSDRGVKTIVDNIHAKLKELNQRTVRIEGYNEGKWVLIDALDVIVHVFHEPARRFYDIEGLWGDAARVELPFDGEAQRDSN
ncbi:MAG: ribosome silencing factor [Deltaproteobacteria bacterium]